MTESNPVKKEAAVLFKIQPVIYRKDGFMNQPFAFGGEVGLFYLIHGDVTYTDEDADLQETNKDLELIELIGVQNWLVQKLTGTGTTVAE